MNETLVALVAADALWISLAPWLPALLALLLLGLAVRLRFMRFGQSGREQTTATLFKNELEQLDNCRRQLEALKIQFGTLAGGSVKESKEALFLHTVTERYFQWLQAAAPWVSEMTADGMEKRRLYLENLLNDLRSMTDRKVKRNLEGTVGAACNDAVAEAVRITDRDLDMADKRPVLQALLNLVDAAGMRLINPREGELYRAVAGGVARRVGQVTTRGLADRHSRVIREPEFDEAV